MPVIQGKPVGFAPIDQPADPIAGGIDERPSRHAYRGEEFEPPAGWEEASNETPADIPTWEALWNAAHDNAELNSATNGGDQALWRAYDSIIRKGRAVGLQSDFNPVEVADRKRDPRDINIDRSDPFAKWHESVNEQLKNNPKLAAALEPITRQTIAGMADQLRRDAQAKYEDIRSRRGNGFFSLDTLADLSAGMAASARDPVQLATAPIGLGSKTVVGAIVKEAAVNGAVEAAMQPFIIPDQVRLGNIATWEEGLQAAGANVATAMAFGAAIGGTGKGLEIGVPAAWNAIPGVKRDKLMRGWVDELKGIQFNDSAVQSAVMGMVSDIVENGTLRTTRSTADFLREAAGKAVDPKAAARLGEMAQQIDEDIDASERMPESFDQARDALSALARINEETDPEAAAIIRKAAADAERDFETARQAPEGVERDEFYDAVEAADAKLRGLTEFIERPEPRRADPPADRIDTSDDAPAPKLGDRLSEDGKPVTFTSFDPRKLGVAPDEFQYKRFNGQEGVNGAIADVGQWHAPSSGKILVFERANGELVVADGHQRRAKALEISSAQGRDDIKLDGYLYREADGWTVAEMRLKGAQKNIREGRSDVLDTAQALRESPNAIDSSFPVSRSNIRQARQLARLSPEAWDLTRAGVLEPQHAALIGQVAPDRPDIHGPLARTLIEAAPDNQRQAENILSEALLDYAERNADTQASLFGDDNLGRAVLYKERAQIMDAAYSWLRSERSVFKALVDNGDIARAIGNDLVDAANLTAKDQVELAIAAIMHSRKAGVRTAVSDMISRALDSVRREGVTPKRAGQQVAREIRALLEERGFRALLDAEGPRPPEMSDAGPLFDGPGSKAHAEHADLLEGDLRPEGREDPGVDLAKTVEQPDEMTSLVMELKNAEPGGERTPEQVLEDIRKLLAPEKPKASKSADPVQSAKEEIGAEFRRLDQAETALREALAPLTDAQKISLIRMQYPDAYATLNRLEGADLDDAIVGRVLLGDLMFARGRSDTPETYRVFNSDVLSPIQNKIVEMAMNGISNLDIGVEMGITAKSAREALARAKRKLADAGTPVTIEPGAMGRPSEGKLPGEMKLAAIELFEQGLEAQVVLARLQAQGFPTNIETVHVYYSNWRSAKRKGVKFAADGEMGVNSRGATALEIIDQIKTEFGDGAMALMRVGELNVTDVPPPWVASNTWGITDARGRVTLFAANVDRDMVRGLMLHEVGVHAGLEGMLGAQGKARVLGDIETRMRAAAPDHPLFGGRTGAKHAAPSMFEPLSKSAAQDLVDLPEAQWAAAIKANKYAAYELPDGVEDVTLPSDYVVVRTEDATYAVRQDHLRDREAAGASVTLLSGDKSIVAAMNKVPLNTPTEHIAEETLAYLVQHAPKHAYVTRLIADIRTWLYKTFPKLQEWMTLTDADLHSLAMGAIRQRIKEAGWSTPVATTKSGAPFFEPIRLARDDTFGVPQFRAGYEARDLVLMYNDALSDARIVAELSLSAGREINMGTVTAQMVRVRAALKELRKDPARYAAAAEQMAVDPRELDAFLDNKHVPRHPTLKSEARRLVESNAGDTKRMLSMLRTYADQHGISFTESSLKVLVSQARTELGKPTGFQNSVTTPEQRAEVHARRMKGEPIIDIATAMKLPYDNVSQVITNARAAGDVFPPTPRRQGGFSTGPVKYARRRADEPTASPRSTVSGRTGGPGRAGARQDAGALAGASERGAGQPGAQPARAVVREPIPSAPFVQRRWNDRVELSAEQRAARREQFKEFVDTVEIDAETSRGLGDFKFKNGKRTGDRGAFESVAYTLRQPDDMHPSWADAFNTDNSRLEVEIHGGEATVPYSRVAQEFRSTGLGQKLYMRAIDDLLARGIVANSDTSMSDGAIALWKSLRKQGYEVIQRVPDALLERGPDNQMAARDGVTAPFFIAQKKPPMPDLPISDRDLSNQIEEARALNEHIPSCIKGK